jgi:hypothetical protein
MERGTLLQEAMDRIDIQPIPMTVETELARLAPAFAETALVPWVHALLESYQQIVSGRSSSLSLFFVQLVVVSASIDHVAHDAIRTRTRRIITRRVGM